MLHIERALAIGERSRSQSRRHMRAFGMEYTLNGIKYNVTNVIKDAYNASIDQTLDTLQKLLKEPRHRVNRHYVTTGEFKDDLEHELRVLRFSFEDFIAKVKETGVRRNSEKVNGFDHKLSAMHSYVNFKFSELLPLLSVALQTSYFECIQSIRVATINHFSSMKNAQVYFKADETVSDIFGKIKFHLKEVNKYRPKYKNNIIPSSYFHDVPYSYLMELLANKSLRLCVKALEQFLVEVTRELHPAVQSKIEEILSTNDSYLPGVLWRLSKAKEKLVIIQDKIPTQVERDDGMRNEWELDMHSSVEYTHERNVSFNYLTKYLYKHATTDILHLNFSLDDMLVALDSVHHCQTTGAMWAPVLGSSPEVKGLIETMLQKIDWLITHIKQKRHREVRGGARQDVVVPDIPQKRARVNLDDDEKRARRDTINLDEDDDDLVVRVQTEEERLKEEEAKAKSEGRFLDLTEEFFDLT